jgi:tRNA threonylcarbamoyl adenosine modification protein YeaZ
VRALVVDSSSAAVVVAVVDVCASARAVAQQTAVAAHAHGELLAPALAACLESAGAAVDAVVAGVGPGPFTGLRVGLMSAAAFGYARALPTYGVCSLDGIGASLPGTVLVAGDARRREIYWSVYADGVRQGDPAVDRPADVLAHLSGNRPDAMAGAGARMYADVLGLPLLDQDFPDPVTLAGLAGERIRSMAPSETLVPAYLREPDATPPVLHGAPLV